MGKLKTAYSILHKSLQLFLQNDPLRMAGATAFFTMFALPPILIILVQTFSLVIDPKTIRHEVFISLSETFGTEAVRQIVSVIQAVRKFNFNWPATILGFIFLIFVATTVFKVVSSSISQLWDIEKIAGKKVIATLQSRVRSLAVIFFTGVLFSVAVFIETVQVFIGNYFIQIFPSLSALFNQLLSFSFSTLIIALWFLFIFRYLTSHRPAWNTAWWGALFTGFLFSGGKSILHVLLTYNNINNIYGTSASIVLLLLFVFYSAMIMYYGAAFTKTLEAYKKNAAGNSTT